MSVGREQPVDLSASFVERGLDVVVTLESASGTAVRVIALRDLLAVGTDLVRLQDGDDIEEDSAEAGRGGSDWDRAKLARLGQRLFDCLFDGADRELFVRAADTARREQRPLRLLIKLVHNSPLERVPWEILHDGRRFIAKEARSAVVRYFSDRQEVPAFQVAAPLRVLITSACPPQDASDIEAEIKAVCAVYGGSGGLARSVVERNVSLDQLENLWRGAELLRRPFHVWHHCGHGIQIEEDDTPRFLLTLERRGVAEHVSVDQLCEVVGACPDLRLAVLSVCHGGSPVGIVPELARLNVPVVVGYPRKVENDVAYTFAAVFHQALLQIPVELAVSLARRALARHVPMALEWSMPLLVSRRRDWGPILRWLQQAVRAGASRERRQSGVTVEVDGVRAGGDVVVSGVVEPHTADQVRLKAARVSAKGSVDIAGVRRVSGFSEREVRLREQRMDALLKDLARAFAAGGTRHEP
jgi:CHAT domain